MHVPKALVLAAPERTDEAMERLRDVSIVRTNDFGFGFSADSDAREIRVPTSGIELLWAMSLAVWANYLGHAAPSEPPDRSEWQRLLEWAILRQSPFEPPTPWPAALPRPTGFSSYTGNAPPERVADDLCMCAAGWILHHELAHITNGDSGQVGLELSLEQELEADRSASEWLLSECREPVMRSKRLIGVFSALLSMVAVEARFPPKVQRTHPPALNRLQAAIALTDTTRDSAAIAAAIGGLRLMIPMFGGDLPLDEESGVDVQSQAHLVAMHRAVSLASRS